MKIFSLVSILACLSFLSFGQKKVIDHTAYDEWKTLKNEQISPSGKYITYEIQPLKGDTYLYWYNTETNTLDSVNRAKNASFSKDETYLIYTIEAGYDTLRKVELDKVDKKKWPKDSLAIYNLVTKKLIKYPNLKASSVGEKHYWVSILEDGNDLKEKKTTLVTPSKKKKDFISEEEFDKKSPEKSVETSQKSKSNGKILRLRNLTDGTTIAFKNVMEYSIAANGKYMAYVTNTNDTTELNYIDLNSFAYSKVDKTFKGIERIVIDTTRNLMVFLGSQDTTKTKVFELYLYDFNNKNLKSIIDTATAAIPKNWTVVKNFEPRFSEKNDLLYFGVYDRPQPEQKDTLLESEKPKFDLWTYNEPVLQTEQIASLKNEGKKAFWYAYNLATNDVIPLESDSLSLQNDFYKYPDFVIGKDRSPYRLESMWDYSGKQDYYKINLKTGEKELIKKGITRALSLDPTGNLFTYFNHVDGQYYILNMATKNETCITCVEKNLTWSEDNNGMPMEYTPIGHYGWDKDGENIYLSEKNDFYAFNLKEQKLINLTQNIGRTNNIEFTIKKWQNDSLFASLDNFYLTGLDLKTKGVHLYTFVNNELKKQAYWDAKIISLKKAKNAETFIIRKQTVKDYPDVSYWKDSTSLIKQISNTNPQQTAYNWATVELIDWKTYKGKNLQGLVYKPENFDPNKKYPLLVYYYELYSHDFHNHYTPRPTASIIFPTEYASGDYIVFIPDIRYEPGYPARSAYDCIMSGTDAILKKYPNIDSTRMGLQGQSWGGYQTAQLITMTTRYKAAMAGAPVGNMFSAYGGIRWGSGLSRQFQYEKTQSRIGKTIWEAPYLYIENSPIFHLPKVQTPLLIMHNDGDGAVPWYQGIEIFTGLRRLGKPAWLLNYNGDDHNLMKIPNRRDLSIRMRQFFDHYLHNKPAPKWLIDGIPANRKGKELRYEID